MKIKIIFLTFLLLMGCDEFKGPEGPTGPRGVKGEEGDININIIQDILYNKDKTEQEWPNWSYWDITISGREKSIVTVYTRKGSGFMWVEPEWYLGNNSWYVRIFETNGVTAGYEYKITIAY